MGRYYVIHQWCPRPATPFWAILPASVGRMGFLCDLRDAVGREVCFTGQYEAQETALVRQILRPGMTFVDVGANWGYYTLLGAHLVGDSGRVVSLEPHPLLYAWLELNVRRNRLAQVTTLRMAAAECERVLPLWSFAVSDGNYGLSRIGRHGAVETREQLGVPACDLDTILKRVGAQTVDLMKMDIEGAEGLAVAGLERALSAHRIRRLLLELHPAEPVGQGMSAADLVARLAAAGYAGWTIDHSAQVTRTTAYARDPRIERFLSPSDGTVPHDGWPHMLWTVCGEPPLIA
jgi:FkbM family methyltransferase